MSDNCSDFYADLKNYNAITSFELIQLEGDDGELCQFDASGYHGSDSAAAVARANLEELVSRLESDDGVDPGSYWGECEGILTAHVFNEDGSFTRAFAIFAAAEKELEDYPILNEDRWAEIRDHYVDETWQDYAEQARDLIEAGDCDAIERAVDSCIEPENLIERENRESAVEELAREIAETNFAD